MKYDLNIKGGELTPYLFMMNEEGNRFIEAFYWCQREE